MYTTAGIQGQVLEINVVGCRNLKDKEWLSRQDPYVIIEYATNRLRTKTDTDGGRNPSFNEKFTIPLIEGLREINVQVWNSSSVTFDDLIGSGRVHLEKALSTGYDDTSWPLTSRSGKHGGELRLIMHYSHAASGDKASKSGAHCVPGAPAYPPGGYPGYPLPAGGYPPPPGPAGGYAQPGGYPPPAGGYAPPPGGYPPAAGAYGYPPLASGYGSSSAYPHENPYGSSSAYPHENPVASYAAPAPPQCPHGVGCAPAGSPTVVAPQKDGGYGHAAAYTSMLGSLGHYFHGKHKHKKHKYGKIKLKGGWKRFKKVFK